MRASILLPLLSALVAGWFVAPTPARAQHVLGAEAGGPLKAWVARFGAGLSAADATQTVGGITISYNEARVAVSGDACVLVVAHPSSAACAAPIPLGNALGCWEGPGCPPGPIRAQALAAAGALKLPWRSGTKSPDAFAEGPRKALNTARTEAQSAWTVRDPKRTIALLRPWMLRDDVSPLDQVDIAIILARLGEGDIVLEATKRDGFKTLPVSLALAVRVAALMGPELGARALASVMGPEDACAAVSYSRGLMLARYFEAAAELSAAVRKIAPTCIDAFLTEGEALGQRRDIDGVNVVLAAASATHPGAADLLERLKILSLNTPKGKKELVAYYEKRLAAGERSPGLFKVLFALYVKDREGLFEDRLAHYIAESDAHPDNDVSSLFAGVLLHYDKKFARSNALVMRAAPAFPEEPRIYIYQAMNWFNLGDIEKAKSFITQAGALSTKDPDVYYCLGEIYRDEDPKHALDSLKIYWHMTRDSSGTTSGKQRRVAAMMDAIAACIETPPDGPCEGPWEHTFGRAAPKLKAPVAP